MTTTKRRVHGRAPRGVHRAAAVQRNVTVRVDSALKKRWDALIKVVRASKTGEAASFDKLWETVGDIVDRDLFLIGGFEDADDFFERELGEKPRNAYRYIKVARFASPHDEETYGVTKIDAALSYIVAKLGAPLEHPPLPIALSALRIPLPDGNRVALGEARVEDIETATRALARAVGAPTSSAERALKAHFAKHKAFRDVRIRVRGGLVNILGIPAAALGVFATILRTAKWMSQDEARAARTEAKRKGRK